MIPLVIGILMISGVALAMFLVSKGIIGTVNQAQVTINLTQAANATSIPGQTCTVQRDADVAGPTQDVEVIWTAFEGDTCQFTATYQNVAGSAATMRLQHLTVPSGLTAVLTPTSCGATIAPGASVVVTATLTKGANGPVTLNPATDGFKWVRSADFVAGCTTAPMP